MKRPLFDSCLKQHMKDFGLETNRCLVLDYQTRNGSRRVYSAKKAFLGEGCCKQKRVVSKLQQNIASDTTPSENSPFLSIILDAVPLDD